MARVLTFGAHPDDAEFHAGGLLAIHARLGNSVHLVSVTDGSAGHQSTPRVELAKRRLAEARAAAAVIGATVEVWDAVDGELAPTIALRRRVIATIRSIAPDLVLTHRLHDYHPDHRAVAQLVRDACYMVRVPNVVQESPALARDPVVATFADFFTEPAPFRADAVTNIAPVFDTVVAMLDCHASQVYEWIPHTLGLAGNVPTDSIARRSWLESFVGRYAGRVAKAFAPGCEVAEAFEISPYGRKPSDHDMAALFPCL